MTIGSESTRKGTHAGSGTTGPFTEDFRFQSTDEVEVVKYDASNVATVLAGGGVDFTATLVDSGTGGISVTTNVAVESGETLLIRGKTPVTQPTGYKNEGDFNPEKHEASYDRLTMIVQEINNKITGGIKLNPLDDESTIDTELPVMAANRAVVTDTAGTGFNLVTFASLAGSIDTTLGTLANNDFLVYKTSSGTWENVTSAAAASLLTGSLEGLGAEGSNIASATTTDIGAADSSVVEITGTTTISSFGTTTSRNHIWLKFAGALTLTHNASSLILPTGANITTAAGDSCEAVRLASGAGNWKVINYQRANGKPLAETMSSLADDSSPQLGGDLDCNGAQIQWSKGADVASASALPVLTDGNYFDVTGTTTVTSINTTGGPGTVIKLHFDGALTLTHHATDLILPGGANITTAAGDEAEFVEYATGDWRCTSYTKADGTAVVSSVPEIKLCRFNGTGTIAIDSARGVTSLVDNSTGNYTLNFTSNFPAADEYVASVLVGGGGAINADISGTPAAGSVTIVTRDSVNAATDTSIVMVTCIGMV